MMTKNCIMSHVMTIMHRLTISCSDTLVVIFSCNRSFNACLLACRILSTTKNHSSAACKLLSSSIITSKFFFWWCFLLRQLFYLMSSALTLIFCQCHLFLLSSDFSSYCHCIFISCCCCVCWFVLFLFIISVIVFALFSYFFIIV